MIVPYDHTNGQIISKWRLGIGTPDYCYIFLNLKVRIKDAIAYFTICKIQRKKIEVVV